MKAFINLHLFTQTSLDSGSLTMAGAVVHNFSEPGSYLGTVYRGTETVARFHLMVDGEFPAIQVDIDLATLGLSTHGHCDCFESDRDDLGQHFGLNPKGYAVFYVSQGSGGYAVRVARIPGEEAKEQQGKESGAKAFDSRELTEGDIFTATLIRPGTYSVANVNTKARGQIVVAYPKAGKVPYRPPEPVSIQCTATALKPDKIAVEAAQGQVYRFKTPSRIKIELVKPDDGPGGPRPPTIVRWRKPGTLKGRGGKGPSRG